jgi:hypothetical protein
MEIEITTDSNVEPGDHLFGRVRSDVEAALSRFERRLTRVAVHLADENASKSGPDDKRCSVEARPARQKPVGVTSAASTLDAAWKDALRKLATLLERRFDKSDGRRDRTTIRHPESD